MSKQQTSNKELHKQDTTVMLEEYIEDTIIENEMSQSEEMEDSNLYDIKEKDIIVGNALSDYIKQISMYKVLSPEEEVELFKRLEKQDRDAYEKLFNHNLKLVVSVSKHYYGVATNMEPLDVIMEGNIGLTTAIQKFDYKKGYKFSTYATWWIRQAITRAIYNGNNIIRIPVHISEGLCRYRKYISNLEVKGEFCPSDKEIAKAINASIEQVKLYQQILNGSINPTSLNRIANEENDGDTEIMDLVPAQVNVEADYMNQDLRNTLLDILEQWVSKSPTNKQDRQRDIIMRRFGLNGGYPETLEEIGARYGVSRERIRQIEEKFIRYARFTPNMRKLIPYYDK